MLSYKYSDDIKELTNIVDNAELNQTSDVEVFMKAYLKLIWDYKMVGKISDYYVNDILVYRENGDDLKGVKALIQDTFAMLAAFPDMKIIVEDVIVVPTEDEKGFEVFSRRYLTGTNSGFSKYGPPTGKKLGKVCLNLSMLTIRKVNGKWKIVDERCMHSINWIKKTLTTDLVS